MKCQEIKDSLYDFEKDEVSPKEKAAIILHIKSCPGCARELEEIRSLRGVIAAGLHEAPASILHNIRKALKPAAGIFEFFMSPFRVAGAAAAFVALLVVITFNIMNNAPKHEDPTETFMLESYSVTGYALNYEDTEYYDHLSDLYQ
jgi:anti-sigma factor RsiW